MPLNLITSISPHYYCPKDMNTFFKFNYILFEILIIFHTPLPLYQEDYTPKKRTKGKYTILY